jgi:hypothetical protein
VSGDAGGDRDRPVDPRCDHAVDALRARELADGGLVLDRDDRAPVGVLEADRCRVAVAGDQEEPSLTRRAMEPELGRPGA